MAANYLPFGWADKPVAAAVMNWTITGGSLIFARLPGTSRRPASFPPQQCFTKLLKN
ncbi:MAG: hypothetical protein WBF58_23415 [Xanthobacteraceae bacterium]